MMLLGALICTAAIARADAPGDAGRALEEASQALEDGQYQRAASAARSAIAVSQAARLNRTEAYRILGLAEFFAGNLPEAREAFLEFLRLSPDAHLDPAIVPPEAISVFEDVRARHAAELEALRPKPRRKLNWVYSSTPLFGHFYNGESTKGVVISSAAAVFLAANVTSFYVLNQWCKPEYGFACRTEAGTDRTSQARKLRALNALSGAALIGVLVYSSVDGFLGYRRYNAETPMMSVGVLPMPDGAGVQASWAF
jgi:tetratricopeptide (TPR) repeat protein